MIDDSKSATLLEAWRKRASDALADLNRGILSTLEALGVMPEPTEEDTLKRFEDPPELRRESSFADWTTKRRMKGGP